MTKPQIIETPGGERLVVLPVAEYERLIEAAEDLADIAAADATKAALERGEEELLPDWFVDRILSGENPVKVWREYRGLSAESLAAAAGLDSTDLADIESGRRAADAAAVVRISTALSLDPDDLI